MKGKYWMFSQVWKINSLWSQSTCRLVIIRVMGGGCFTMLVQACINGILRISYIYTDDNP